MLVQPVGSPLPSPSLLALPPPAIHVVTNPQLKLNPHPLLEAVIFYGMPAMPQSTYGMLLDRFCVECGTHWTVRLFASGAGSRKSTAIHFAALAVTVALEAVSCPGQNRMRRSQSGSNRVLPSLCTMQESLQAIQTVIMCHNFGRTVADGQWRTDPQPWVRAASGASVTLSAVAGTDIRSRRQDRGGAQGTGHAKTGRWRFLPCMTTSKKLTRSARRCGGSRERLPCVGGTCQERPHQTGNDLRKRSYSRL